MKNLKMHKKWALWIVIKVNTQKYATFHNIMIINIIKWEETVEIKLKMISITFYLIVIRDMEMTSCQFEARINCKRRIWWQEIQRIFTINSVFLKIILAIIDYQQINKVGMFWIVGFENCAKLCAVRCACKHKSWMLKTSL